MGLPAASLLTGLTIGANKPIERTSEREKEESKKRKREVGEREGGRKEEEEDGGRKPSRRGYEERNGGFRIRCGEVQKRGPDGHENEWKSATDRGCLDLLHKDIEIWDKRAFQESMGVTFRLLTTSGIWNPKGAIGTPINSQHF